MKIILTLFLFVMFSANPAWADCSSPDGVESQTRYTANKLYYCGGGAWREVPGSSGGGVGAGCVVGSVYVPGGYTHTFFSADTHANCASISQARTCTNGVLSGSATYQEPFCEPLAPDTTPNAFSFNDVTGAPLNTLTTPSPATVTISGIDASTPVSVSGQGSPQIRIAGGSWVTSGNITNGQTLAVRLTSANTNSTARSATINVGGVTDSWTVTTAAPAPDTTPNSFSFNDVTGAPLNTLTTPSPATVTITGINTSTSVSVSGASSARISINGGAWELAGAITNGQTLAVRMFSATTNSTTYTATINVGGVTDSWTVTTVPGPSCGGEEVGSGCWYPASTNQSCDSACSSRGGCDLTALREAGSSGTGAFCKQVLDAVSIGSGNVETPSDLTGMSPLGCHFNTQTNKRIKTSALIPTTCDASQAQRRRACACND